MGLVRHVVSGTTVTHPHSDCEHEWEKTEMVCTACSPHEAIVCAYCGTIIDLIYEDDPR